MSQISSIKPRKNWSTTAISSVPGLNADLMNFTDSLSKAGLINSANTSTSAQVNSFQRQSLRYYYNIGVALGKLVVAIIESDDIADDGSVFIPIERINESYV